MIEMIDQQSEHLSAGVTCLSTNVGSISDFLFSPSSSSTIESNSTEQIDSEISNELNQSINKEKLGHRRVDEIGNVTYKRVMVDELIKSLQIGLKHVIERYDQPQRQVLLQDFQQIDYQDFPPAGSSSTPPHPYAEFRLKTYAQTAFRFFRNAFGVDQNAFMSSICGDDLRDLPNPGASGSIFYLTADDAYIIKTVSKKEAQFLQSLLPGYYMNLTQNPFTLLPKFFGLFCYQSSNRNIRFVIMNNLIPTNVRLHEKFDLKGSIYKRKASEEEQKRELPTLKDNDFKLLHPEGLVLEPFFYDQLMQTIDDDVRVLRSFGIMDYSLLLAIHNISKEMKSTEGIDSLIPVFPSNMNDETATTSKDSGIATTESNFPTLSQYLRVIDFVKTQQISSTVSTEQLINNNQNPNNDTSSIVTIKAEEVNSPVIIEPASRISTFPHYDERTSAVESPSPFLWPRNNAEHGWYHRQNLSRLAMAGIPATNQHGDLLLLYVGIIDILQNYRLRKQLEHVFKSTLVTREEISVCNPDHYGDRFVRFLSRRIFRKGGADQNKPLSDSQSNIDGVTLYSSRVMNPSSCRSQTSGDDDDNSSVITNNKDKTLRVNT